MPGEDRSRRPAPRGFRALSRRWRLAAAALALVLLALFALDVLLADRAGTRTPTAQEVRGIHTILHRLENACSRRLSGSRRQRLARDVGTLIRFSRTYPRARFQIDDESAHAVSVLLVAREELQRCAPDAAARIDQALPKELRRQL